MKQFLYFVESIIFGMIVMNIFMPDLFNELISNNQGGASGARFKMLIFVLPGIIPTFIFNLIIEKLYVSKVKPVISYSSQKLSEVNTFVEKKVAIRKKDELLKELDALIELKNAGINKGSIDDQIERKRKKLEEHVIEYQLYD